MKLFRGAVDTIKRVYRYEKTTGMDVGALQGVMLIFAVVLFLIDIENFRLGKYVIGIVTLVVGIVSVTAVFVIRRFQKVVLVCRIAVFLFLLLAAAILYAGANDGFFPAVVSAAACYHFGSAWNAVWGTGLYRIRPVDHGVFLDAAYGYINVRLSEGL